MKDTTRTLIETAIASDESVPKSMSEMIMSIIDNDGVAAIAASRPLDRILTRKQVAELFQVTPKMVDVYGRKGYIKRVSLTGKQAQGYSWNSVCEALERGKRGKA